MELKITEIQKATKGDLLTADCKKTVTGISTDSRKVPVNCLFIPLIGENHDGHDYVQSAFENGAIAALILKGISIADDLKQKHPDKSIIEVECTLKALGDLANFWRRKFSTTIIAITGSNGKTTTKEMAFNILKRKLKTIKSPGNWNNLIGVPLSLFQLDGNPDAAIIEMGMSEKGEIKRLAEIAEPQIGLITNIGPSHLENFNGIDAIKDAKGELFDHLKQGNTAIINNDDIRATSLKGNTPAKILSFGIKRGDIRSENISEDTSGMEYDLMIGDKKRHIKTDRPGKLFLSNDLAAASIAHAAGIGIEDIKKGLEESIPVQGRMERIQAGDITIINDTYNANPVSMEAALTELSKMSGHAHRIAILGSMLELGTESDRFHTELGEKAAESNLDYLFLFGGFAPFIKKGAAHAGMPENKICISENIQELNLSVKNRLTQGDVILIKGSRGMQLERVVTSILDNRATT